MGAMKTPPRIVLVLVVAALGALSVGCSKQIGDDCGSAADCDPGQICDKALPGGYCTVTPCEPDSCPEEAVCIDYPPFLSYCMKRCTNDGDCRDDYACVTSVQGIQYCGVLDEAPQP